MYIEYPNNTIVRLRVPSRFCVILNKVKDLFILRFFGRLAPSE